MDEKGKPDLQDAFSGSGAQPEKTDPGAGPSFRMDLKRFSIEEMSIHYSDQSRVDPIQCDLDQFNLTLSASISQNQDRVQARVDTIRADLQGVRLKGSRTPEPALQVGHVSLQDGRLSLTERIIEIDQIALDHVQAGVVRDHQGIINWDHLLKKQGEKETSSQPAQDKESGVSPWAVTLHALKMENSGVSVSDLHAGAPDLLELSQIRLDLKNITNAPGTPVQLDLAMNVGDKGHAALNGQISWLKPELTVGIEMKDIALSPFQPYLDSVAILSLDSGALSAKGKIGYDGDANKGFFRGDLGLSDLLLTLPVSKKRLLAWKSFSARGIDLGLSPDQIKIAEVVLEEPSGELIIRKDSSINVQDVIRKRDDSAQTPAPETVRQTKQDKAAPAFPVDIKRFKIQKGKLDFADLSLLPNFAARIHELTGVIAGLSNRPGRRASMKLDGRVDEYGSAQIKGELDLADAKNFSELSMRFQNVEMANMTPYSGKFAGYRIDSGRLSMDLEYKIQNHQLKGDNHILVDRLTLGERVESPDAMNIPLELALALLKDSNGRIDIGLPVAGNLDDPEFSYGHLIWKALGNFLSKIVTAPFRALASLLGLNNEDLDAIHFEPGQMSVPPPEKEKLVVLAGALEKRPQLGVEIQGIYDPEKDGRFFQSLAVRTELAAKSGVTLEPGEDPGPVNFSDPATRRILERMAEEKLPPKAVEEMKAQYENQNKPGKRKPGKEQIQKSKKLDNTEYPKALFHYLVEKTPIEKKDLEALAGKRAEAIRKVLTEAFGKSDSHRMFIADTVESHKSDKASIACKLSMKALK
jgi:uncharacterized protein involved in outer membrane biogenesis